MRKITEESVEAFTSGLDFKRDNTEVESCESGVKMFLHGHKIAELNHIDNTITLWNCGYKTNVTKERLKGILSAYGLDKISQKAGVWYRAGKEFIDGEVINL